jgi:hypothetical protein
MIETGLFMRRKMQDPRRVYYKLRVCGPETLEAEAKRLSRLASSRAANSGPATHGGQSRRNTRTFAALP